jgi:hypothetical protein
MVIIIKVFGENKRKKTKGVERGRAPAFGGDEKRQMKKDKRRERKTKDKRKKIKKVEIEPNSHLAPRARQKMENI